MQSLSRLLALGALGLAFAFFPVALGLLFLMGGAGQNCPPAQAPPATAAAASAPVSAGARPPYSQAQMEAAVAKFDPAQAHVLGAIAMAESSGYAFPAVNGTGTYHGPWQFQEVANPTLDFHRLDTDLNYSAQQAAKLASTGITHMKWETWPVAYLKFMGGAPSTTVSGKPTAADTAPAQAISADCASTAAALASGGTASSNGWTFPLRTTQAALRKGSQTATGAFEPWCFASLNNCHHDYNAADLMVPTGTPVLAPEAGTAVTVHRGLGPNCAGQDNRGDTISYKADGAGNADPAIFMGHMLTDSLVSHVKVGQHFPAGYQLGVVGTIGNAQCTVPHLHIQANPAGDYGGQTASVNIQPVLVKLFGLLPR